MNQELEQYKNLLKDNDLKVTDKRMKMIEFFYTENKYLNAKEVQNFMNQHFKNVSFDTIYRNLSSLKDINILEETNLNNELHYKISCSNHHHHHFICESCGKTEVIHFCPVEAWESELDGVQIRSHKIELYGFCNTCKKA